MKKNKLSKDLIHLIEQLDWFFEIRYYDRTIRYEKTDKEGINAEVSVQSDYKRVRLNIYPAFFTQPKKEQRKIILHEYVHTVLWPLQMQAYNAVNGKFINNETMMDAVESVTCAVTERLSSLLEGNSKFMVEAYKKVK
mgnify:CR=1 FL=1